MMSLAYTRIGLGTLIAVIAAVFTIAVWPASGTEKARDDGEQLGQAAGTLYAADSAEEVDAALVDVHQAVSDTRENAGDAAAEEAAETEDALARAADGFVGVHSSTDEFESDLYQAGLDTAIEDLDREAGDVRANAAEVEQAYWDGYETGLAGV